MELTENPLSPATPAVDHLAKTRLPSSSARRFAKLNDETTATRIPADSAAPLQQNGRQIVAVLYLMLVGALITTMIPTSTSGRTSRSPPSSPSPSPPSTPPISPSPPYPQPFPPSPPHPPYGLGYSICLQSLRLSRRPGSWGYMRNEVHAHQQDIGLWGGSCTCPNGQVYEVGDRGDLCGSLACFGGSPGMCNRYTLAHACVYRNCRVLPILACM